MKSHSNLSVTCDLFAGMSGEEVDGLLSCLRARTVTVPKGGTLFSVGEKSDRFAVVLSGEFTVATYGLDGKRHILKEVGPMQTMAAAQSLAGAGSFAITVEAQSDSEALVLRTDRVLSPCSKSCSFHLKLVKNLMSILARKTLALNMKIDIISRRATADRVMAYLRGVAADVRSPEFDIPFDRQELADYLCVERSALSAEISRLSRAGVISARKRHFVLQNQKGVKQ